MYLENHLSNVTEVSTVLPVIEKKRPRATGVLMRESCRPHLLLASGVICKGDFDHVQFLPGEHRTEVFPLAIPTSQFQSSQ